eukprot:1933154-Rhodomonas_salina.1
MCGTELAYGPEWAVLSSRMSQYCGASGTDLCDGGRRKRGLALARRALALLGLPPLRFRA